MGSQSHTLPILHPSNPTPFQSFTFQSYTIPTLHSSNLALFQSYTLPIIHSFSPTPAGIVSHINICFGHRLPPTTHRLAASVSVWAFLPLLNTAPGALVPARW